MTTCSICATSIPDAGVDLCRRCEARSFNCKQCGRLSLGVTKEDGVCLHCLRGKSKSDDTSIDVFISKHGADNCGLIRDVYRLDEKLRKVEMYGPLNLFDPPCQYGGTVLYDPRMTPINTVTFATTGGDDVHFGLLLNGKRVSDLSPVIMTVPMGGDSPLDCNMVLGASFREFLCLGCMHGYNDLEELYYNLKTALDELNKPLEELDEDDRETDLLAIYRRLFGLTSWSDPGRRLAELQTIKTSLEFAKK